MEDKKARTRIPVHDLIAYRWSPRGFLDTPVEDGKVMAMLEAARWAPSGGNRQPWFFIVAQKNRNPEVFEKLFSCLNDGNQEWVQFAPLLMLGITCQYREDGSNEHYGQYALGMAVENMSLQALSQGVFLHQMGGFYREKARERFEIPDRFEPTIMIAGGYPGNIALLSERNRSREKALRERKPLKDFVFGSKWGEVHHLIDG